VFLFLLALLASGAQAEDLQPVTAHGKIVLLDNLLLQALDTQALELDDLSTIGADKVVVVMVTLAGLVKGLPGAEVPLLGDAALGEQLQGAVDGGITDAGMLATNPEIQTLGGKMIGGVQKFVKDRLPLAGRLQTFPGHKLSKKLAFFRHQTLSLT
jgi:hypothetical protein